MESANAADQLSRIRQGLQAKALAGERGLLQVMWEQVSELCSTPYILAPKCSSYHPLADSAWAQTESAHFDLFFSHNDFQKAQENCK